MYMLFACNDTGKWFWDSSWRFYTPYIEEEHKRMGFDEDEVSLHSLIKDYTNGSFNVFVVEWFDGIEEPRVLLHQDHKGNIIYKDLEWSD